jgi:hypothetical protein
MKRIKVNQSTEIRVVVRENKDLTAKQRRAAVKYLDSRKKAEELKSLKDLYIRERYLLLEDG